ncbi:hypothetical protein MVEN_02152100 [Mycena venus]|uniref:Uncharacterized protein n=1 Tax=Mycena venus TaxID=2733690 RepID=A0A8H6XAT5_9AGAR|nr:hypothetical protein MVEN_02152100 [Mycena venus]
MLTLKEYHNVCSLFLSHVHHVNISLSMIVNVGAVAFWPKDDVLEHWVEIASLVDAEIYVGSWVSNGRGNREKLENGWTRFRSKDTIGNNIYLWIHRGAASKSWLGQANHIFSCLEITSDFEDYALVHTVNFRLTISRGKTDCPSGFLFLCPENHFQIGPSSFTWPVSPAYWSLDSLGINRLSTEEAARLGFPAIQLNTQIRRNNWDDSIYIGLRQFHQGKGFNPNSQDVARHLGYPLYQLSNEIEVPFAHVTEEDSDEEDDRDAEDVDTTNEPEEGWSAAIKENCMLLEDSALQSYSEGHVPFTWSNVPVQEQEHLGDPLAEHLFLGQGNEFQIGQSLGWDDAPAYWSNSAGAHCPSQQVTHYGVPNTGPDMAMDGLWSTGVYGGVGQFHQANVFDIYPHLGHPLAQLSHDANVPFAHVEEVTAGEVQSLANTGRQFDNLWPSASADRVPEINREKEIPVKHSFEEIVTGLPGNTSEQRLEGSIQDDLALRHLMLEEKAQLIEMQRLGMFTKEEFISRLAQIDAHYKEPAARPTPAKRLRLSN